MANTTTPPAAQVGDRRDGWAAPVLARAGQIEAAGGAVLRYGLVAILVAYGLFKFTDVEAKGIERFVANSPFFGWMHALLGYRGVSSFVGATELVVAGLIVTRRWLPAVSAVGSLLAAGMFLTTLSFLFTTPGSWESPPDFPTPIPTVTGGFLVKDVILFGAALWTAGEALRAARRGVGGPASGSEGA